MAVPTVYLNAGVYSIMTFDAVPTLDPRLCLEIPPTWLPPSSASTTSGSQQRMILNQAMLEAMLPWLQEDYSGTVQVMPNRASLSSIWEHLNGTAITLNDLRLVLVPTIALDESELEVAQEWIDSPSWMADYYISVSVNLEDSYITVLGYTSHANLKQQASFDASDRTYRLDHDDLIADLNLLFLTQELCPPTVLRAEVAPLPTLDLTQAENLLTRLGNPAVIFPRLAVPFPLWAALIEHDGWRKRLHALRHGMSEAWSIRQWLQTGVSSLAQQVGWSQANLQLQPVRVGLRSASLGVTRPIQVADRTYELSVGQLDNPEAGIWRFQLRSTTPDPLPTGMTLRLLTEDLQAFDNNQDIASEGSTHLYVDVMLTPGEGLIWEVTPTPNHYEREILRF